jgi:anti-sigma factor RsiW
MHTRRVTQKEIAQLSAYIDGQLSAQAAASLQKRLDSDDALFEAYTELLLMKESLQTLPTPTPPRSLRLDVAQLEAARGWRWWLIAPPGGRVLPAMSMLASLAVCVVLVQALVQPPSMTDDVLPLKGSAVQLSDADDASLNAPQSEAMEVAPALADNQSSSESGDGALSTVEDSMPTSRTVGGVTDEALAVDLSQFVMMVGVVMAALGMIASVRWLWQVRPTRR